MFACFIYFLTHTCPTVKHSLKNLVTGSYGIPIIPDFVGVLMVDGIQTGYCDSSSKTLQPQQDWAKKLLENNTQQRDWYNKKCFEDQPKLFKDTIFSLKQQFNQGDAVHILQMIEGCEWDENTGEVTGVLLYGYNGEAFMDFDLKTLTWIALKPEAVITKQKWDTDRLRIKHKENDLTNICPAYLKMYVDHKKGFSQKKVLPSVFLLQKTPSSPVSCHATGFYPGRAVMSWRKDGEELHEGVALGEILPNNDETFQMCVDLNVSSVTTEDWSRYDCVFQLSDGDDIITKLDKKVIRTNCGKIIPVIVLPSVSLLQKTPSSPVSCQATGFYPDRAVMFWRKDGVHYHQTGQNSDQDQLG
uniref:Ig-like domain-containing protein n=1 Tax=Maylandia zebra TaxID=106582 RepID=A0A3P9D833_9CICH